MFGTIVWVAIGLALLWFIWKVSRHAAKHDEFAATTSTEW